MVVSNNSFIFSPLLKEMILFDYNDFQKGPNCSNVRRSLKGTLAGL